MTTGRINQVSRLEHVLQQPARLARSAPAPSNTQSWQTLSQQSAYDFNSAALGQPVNSRLSYVRLHKLKQFHERLSHGERSPPRHNNCFARVDRTLKRPYGTQAPTLAVKVLQSSSFRHLSRLEEFETQLEPVAHSRAAQHTHCAPMLQQQPPLNFTLSLLSHRPSVPLQEDDSLPGCKPFQLERIFLIRSFLWQRSLGGFPSPGT